MEKQNKMGQRHPGSLKPRRQRSNQSLAGGTTSGGSSGGTLDDQTNHHRPTKKRSSGRISNDSSSNNNHHTTPNNNMQQPSSSLPTHHHHHHDHPTTTTTIEDLLMKRKVSDWTTHDVVSLFLFKADNFTLRDEQKRELVLLCAELLREYSVDGTFFKIYDDDDTDTRQTFEQFLSDTELSHDEQYNENLENVLVLFYEYMKSVLSSQDDTGCRHAEREEKDARQPPRGCTKA